MDKGSGVRRLFCFGLGYSAEVLARRLKEAGWSIAGTAREEANIARLRDCRIRCRPVHGRAVTLKPLSSLAG